MAALEKVQFIKETLEDSKRRKRINKNLALGNQWTTYRLNEKEQKIYHRQQILIT